LVHHFHIYVQHGKKFVRHERKNVHHPEKMSITGQKMSIIAPGVHHRPRYVQNPVPIGHCPAPIPFSNCRRMPSAAAVHPSANLPANHEWAAAKNGGFPVCLPAKRNMCRSGLAPSQGRLFLNPPAGKKRAETGHGWNLRLFLNPAAGTGAAFPLQTFPGQFFLKRRITGNKVCIIP
jgi:hypothetical protein